MEFENILKLIDKVSDSNLTSFEFDNDDISITIKTDKKTKTINTVVSSPIQAAPQNFVLETAQPTSTASAPACNLESGTEAVSTGNIVQAPLVGTYYSAAGPDKDDFVKVGDTIKKGQVLCIIEAMKCMNEIESDHSGVLKEILVENGQMVEYGQKMFVIE